MYWLFIFNYMGSNFNISVISERIMLALEDLWVKKVIEAHNVNYKYPDGYRAIKNVSFYVNEGEKLGIIGANGAGKSTMLKLLIGILSAESGKIIINDILINKKNLKETIVIASHDLDMILDVCDRVLVLNNGEIIQEGQSYSILSNKKIMEESNLELPLSLIKNKFIKKC